MKKMTILVSAVAAMAAVNVANANSTATMNITGKIVPPTCNISFNGGTSSSLNMGAISPGLLSEDEFSALPELKANLSISCPAATLVGFKAKDVSDGAQNVKITGMDVEELFSLGSTESGASIGGYIVTMESGTIDDSNIGHFLSSFSGKEWDDMNSGAALDPTSTVMYSWSSINQVPQMGRQHQINLVIKPYINAMKELGTSDTIELNGQATYDIVYL
ncbi:hypothetical protein IBT47_11785 [Erwinia sp. S43]|uniref:hypothetical protein n=1 Tax=unclassified Erwinia TaxID=2622719 RepID=UPI00190E37EE|nr:MULTISPECIES: hypothetical protein [unclassified Erwinia]MBK0032963.1 hypothetical protein [Erwinia sp. S43]MCW1873447.1 hypothetical protein [Erwinia sp. INIA01]